MAVDAAPGAAGLVVSEPAPAPATRIPSPPAASPPTAPRRQHHRPPRRAIVPVLLLIGALVWWGYTTYQAALPRGPLTASGTVEADEVLIAPEVGGRIVGLFAEEGRSVSRGDVIAHIDDALIRLQMEQADPAMRRQLEIQAERYTVRAPIGGVVTRVPAKPGEVAAPGQTLAAVADLSRLKLTLYVLERDLGSVQVGQTVYVAADPYPGRTFQGQVTSISSRAEFTPRNVQTQKDRQNLVFGVKVRVENPDRALKPGLPVDATFAPLP